MANMSYCRFRNTLEDLYDCYENMGQRIDKEDKPEEYRAREKMIELCQRIADEYGEGDE